MYIIDTPNGYDSQDQQACEAAVVSTLARAYRYNQYADLDDGQISALEEIENTFGEQSDGMDWQDIVDMEPETMTGQQIREMMERFIPADGYDEELSFISGL